jgi:protein SCO1/2
MRSRLAPRGSADGRAGATSLALAGILLLAGCVGDQARTLRRPTPGQATPGPPRAGATASAPAAAATPTGAIPSSAPASSPATVLGSSPVPFREAGDAGPAPPIAGLVLPDGSAFELASLSGHPVLLFFGYTHCPDVCPTTIGTLLQVLDEAPDARVVFVSIDPERDTPDFLGDWVRYFPDGFVALTGSPAAVRSVADGYGARYARVDTTSTAGYAMAHTALVYLIDASGRLRASYPFGTPPETIMAGLARLGRT